MFDGPCLHWVRKLPAGGGRASSGGCSSEDGPDLELSVDGRARKMRTWTEDEKAVLRKWYPTLGAEGCSRHLDRTIRAIIVQAFRMGLAVEGWKASEDLLLCVCWDKCSAPYLRARYFPNRTEAAIRARARRLGLRASNVHRLSARAECDYYEVWQLARGAWR